jgi:hypothetical protein
MRIKKMVYNTLMVSAILLLTGCTPMINKYRVSVDAITNPNIDISPTSYIIEPLGKSTDKNSLEFQKHSSQLMTILHKKGYTQPNNSASAKQTIYFDYGIDKVKEETTTYTQPNISFGFYHGYYHPFWGDFIYNNYSTYQKTYVLYNRYIEILAKNQAGKELWRVDVSSVGESTNLKSIVPILLEGAEEFIGKNTDKPVNLVIKEKREKKSK